MWYPVTLLSAEFADFYGFRTPQKSAKRADIFFRALSRKGKSARRGVFPLALRKTPRPSLFCGLEPGRGCPHGNGNCVIR